MCVNSFKKQKNYLPEHTQTVLTKVQVSHVFKRPENSKYIQIIAMAPKHNLHMNIKKY